MSGPPATGQRLPYVDVAPAVRSWVQAELGAPVADALDQPGGFSPGVAARLRTVDGRRAFVKAVDGTVYPDSAEFHRREIRVAAALPEAAPAPQLLASYDAHGWVAMLFEDVDGRQPHVPWDAAELRLVIRAVDRLAATLTPAPAGALPDLVEHFAGVLGVWSEVDPGSPGLDGWPRRHLADLRALERGWQEAGAGDTLLHSDLRADNLLITSDGDVVVVDWPHACVGAAWLDAAFLAPSVEMQGGPRCEVLVGSTVAGRAAEPDALACIVAAMAGFLVHRSLLPPPPGLPTLRAFQAAQGAVALRWLAALTGWS